MDNTMIDNIVSILKSGKSLPSSYQEVLFPVNNKEYTLQYKDKKSKEQILSVGDEPQAVPFQIEKEFNCTDGEWQNLLICGDNYQALKTIYENRDELIQDKVKGKVKLIYIDPPFATDNDFVSKDGAKAYSDKVKDAEFIEFLRERLILAKEILAPDGTIYVHLDSKKSHYIKVILDEIFTEFEFAEIMWLCGLMGSGNYYPKAHEVIYCYKAKGATFNPPHRLGLSTRITKALQKDENGWYYTRGREGTPGGPNAKRYLKTYVCDNPDFTKQQAINYANETRKQTAWSVWIGKKDLAKAYNDYPVGTYAYRANKSVDYPTQKPIELLERIINASSNPGDIVMDFFAGSGTTLVAAEKLGRRWIGCDIGKLSIYTIQRRLLTMGRQAEPFCLVNAGCYNLNAVFELEKEKYYTFVLDLFHIDRKKYRINGITVDGKRRGDWVKVFTIVNQYRSRKNEAIIRNMSNELVFNNGETEMDKLPTFKEIVAFIKKSMQEANISGNELTAVNIEKINGKFTGLLRKKRTSAGFESKVKGPISMNTTDMERSSARYSSLRNGVVVFYTNSYDTEISADEKEVLDQFRDDFPGKLFKQKNVFDFKTPLNIVFTTRDPEFKFVEVLTKTSVAQKIDAWVKSRDVGFYKISYLLKRGSHPKEFNPDFFIKVGNRIAVIETKMNNDITLENYSKMVDAKKHFATLNEELQKINSDIRYSFNILSPSSYPDFEAKLIDGSYFSGFNSEIEIQLQETYKNKNDTTF